MQIKTTLALFGFIALTEMMACGQIHSGTLPGVSNNRSGGASNGSDGSSLADTEWKGIYGSGTSSNIPATLKIYSRNGSLGGTLTYDGYEETAAITATGPRSLRIKGVSYRDLRGGRTFDLDTFTAQITPDGRNMNAVGGGTRSVVANEWLRVQKVDSSGGAPQPAPQSFVRSLAGSNWDGAIAEGQKGGTPAQLRIVQQNGAMTAILTYEGFEEVLALTFTAPSGIQMRGTSFRDLQNRNRSFTLDKLQGEVSSDGHRLEGQINGRQHLDFRRLN